MKMMRKNSIWALWALCGMVSYHSPISAAEVIPALPSKPIQSFTPASTLESGTVYYLYNEGANGFLTSKKTTNHDSDASVISVPDANARLTLTQESDGTWRVKTPRYPGATQFMFDTGGGLIYMDSAGDNVNEPSKWTITGSSGGKFRIASSYVKAANESAEDNAKKYAAPASKSPARVYPDKTELSAPAYLDWTFYEATSFDPVLYEARAKLYEWLSEVHELLSGQAVEVIQTAYENAVGIYDTGTATEAGNALASLQRAVSSHMISTGQYIYNPSFDTGTFGWTSNVEFGYGYTAVEIFRKGISDFSQTIFGLPRGLYKLTAQGFYRNDGGNNAYMYAGSVEKQLNVRTGSENNMQQAENSFVAGLYPMSIVFSHYETGDLTIGIKNKDALNNWIIFDLFNLEKLGDDPVVASQDLIDELADLIAEAEVLCAGDPQLMEAINEEKAKAAGYEAFLTNSSEVDASIKVIKFALATIRGNYVTNTRLAGTFSEVHSGTHAANADEKETITLPAGKYTLMGNAFHRRHQQGNTQAGIDRYKNGTEEIAAYLYVTPSGEASVTQPIRSIYSKEADLISFSGGKNGYPDNVADGTAAFNLGYYQNVLNFELAEEKEVTVGIKITSGNWNGFGRFRLFKSGEMELSLTDKEQYIAPALGATVKEITYVRNFPEKKVNPNTGNGWQSLCLPFHVTSIKLGETELIPGTNCWLFEATNGNYVPATEIEAHKYYLMSLPNDPEYYVEELCLYGDVTFTGTELAGKTDFTEIAVTGNYSVAANYEGAYTHAVMGDTYGMTDVGETTYFVKGQYNGTFWAHAKAVGSGSFESFGVFGEVTADRHITGDLPASESLIVTNIEGGIRIDSEKSQYIQIYTISGRLIEGIQIPLGTSLIKVPAGQYVVNGQKIIVNN